MTTTETTAPVAAPETPPGPPPMQQKVREFRGLSQPQHMLERGLNQAASLMASIQYSDSKTILASLGGAYLAYQAISGNTLNAGMVAATPVYNSMVPPHIVPMPMQMPVDNVAVITSGMLAPFCKTSATPQEVLAAFSAIATGIGYTIQDVEKAALDY